MTQRASGLVLLLVLLSSLAEAQGRNVDVFDRLLPALKKQTSVPLRLPTRVPIGMSEKDCSDPEPDQKENKPECLQAFVESVSAQEYVLYVGFGDDCAGAHVCEVGWFRGNTKPIELQEGKRKKVRLAHNIEATYVEGLCGAYCADDGIYWREGTFYYSIELKAANGPADLVSAANSAILANPPPRRSARK